MWMAKSIEYELCDVISFLKNDVIERILCWKIGKWFCLPETGKIGKNFTWLLMYSSIYYSVQSFSPSKKSVLLFWFNPPVYQMNVWFLKKDLVGKFIGSVATGLPCSLFLLCCLSVDFLRISLFCHGLALLKMFGVFLSLLYILFNYQLLQLEFQEKISGC